MQLNGGTNNLLIGGIVTLCAAPAITLNVWPRIEGMITSGISSNEVGIVLLVTVSALGMTCVPFAMKKAESWGFWTVCLAFGLGLAVLNYIMAVGAIGKISDHATASQSAIISKAESLKSQLEELRAARRELGAFRPTTEDQLRAADEAVKLAENARRQECEKVGDHCRARVAQLQSRLSERNEIASGLSLSKRASLLTTQITTINEQVQHLGAVPLYSNPQAERIKSIVRWVVPAAATEEVANGIIHMLAIFAELFALGMPRIIVTALSRGPGAPEGRKGPLPLGMADGRQARISAVNNTNAPRSLPASRPAPASLGAIIEWKDQNLQPRSGNRLKCWEVFKAYENWCKARNQTPVTPTAFDYELTITLKVKKEAAARSFYLDVVLASTLKVVA